MYSYYNIDVENNSAIIPLVKEANKIMAIKAKPGESLDSMLRRFKKEVTKAEILKELRKREYYLSPSEKRRRKSAEALKKKQAKQKMY